MPTKSMFMNFEWVIPGRLARSSAPHYKDKDEDQNMDQAAVNVLREQRIDSVISLNSILLSNSQQTLLANSGINYLHVAVPDFNAPSLSQLRNVYQRFSEGQVVLVYCGFGHGRTGTAISAIQIYGGASLKRKDYDNNHVEKDSQRAVLDQLQKLLRPNEHDEL